MKILSTIEEVQKFRNYAKKCNHSIGFVPTMGALHAGHASLIQESVEKNNSTIVSIFVNPKQFDQKDDLLNYPKTFEFDCKLAEKLGADVVFYPGTREVYPDGFSSFIDVDTVTQELCGKFRPEHFRGVATVVMRLFQIVQADRAYFGLKDIQQCMVIQQMVKDFLLPIELEFVETVREADGLALSSRNAHLNSNEREMAPSLYRCLNHVDELLAKGERDASKLVAEGKHYLQKIPEIDLQYLELLSYPRLQAVDYVETKSVLAIAAFLGSTRLIDNLIIRP